jgi:hypothetical protein
MRLPHEHVNEIAKCLLGRREKAFGGFPVEACKTFNTLINQYPNSIYQTRAKQWMKQLKKDLEYFQE